MSYPQDLWIVWLDVGGKMPMRGQGSNMGRECGMAPEWIQAVQFAAEWDAVHLCFW